MNMITNYLRPLLPVSTILLLCGCGYHFSKPYEISSQGKSVCLQQSSSTHFEQILRRILARGNRIATSTRRKNKNCLHILVRSQYFSKLDNQTNSLIARSYNLSFTATVTFKLGDHASFDHSFSNTEGFILGKSQITTANSQVQNVRARLLVATARDVARFIHSPAFGNFLKKSKRNKQKT
jgi:outer membrane lipopolysaccharide assembly protein LptE/RlpB